MKKFLMNKKILSFLTSILLCLSCFNLANASIFSLDSDKNVSIGQRISVDISVDPENFNINSVESTINFSSEYFDFNGFSVTQSSIPIWVEEPKEIRKGAIHFAGVIPGGIERLYDPIDTKNKAIPIIRLFFITKQSGSTELTFGDSQILKNDGKGTKTPLTFKSLEINISKDKVERSILENDNIPPLPFKITLIDRSIFGRTPRQAVFIAEDEEGGIQRYEVAVGSLNFKNAESPFSLPYRLFPYNLTVRAYDFSGNFREQQITIQGDSPLGMFVLTTALLVFIVLLRYRFNKRRKYENPN
ncbi:MAG: hypothetical protein KBC11_03245 [Candidatus Pacebacteria bacterium]|nr:hypothetical protein [Candidatus Paceibacterota bacterium]